MKKIHLSLVFVVSCLLFVPSVANAQLQTTAMTNHPTWNADSLVRNIMLGEGVEIYDVTVNGNPGVIGSLNGVGIFSTGNIPTNLGLQSGIVLTTSTLAYLTTPNAGTNVHNNSTLSTDADLYNIVGNNYSINNCMYIEFKFRPRSDSVRFRYVFSSVEYTQYECTQFNDVFAFLLSGPKPATAGGGMYTKENIARVPGTNPPVPITISSVHGRTDVTHNPSAGCYTTYSQYYVNNVSETYLKNMKGFTVPLTAEAAVIPCAEYTLKMAIANVSDDAYPSAVFLEANSLTSNAITFDFVNAANPNATSELYEGCVATVTLSRPQAKYENTSVSVAYSGTATNGIDFTMVNPYISFPAGQNSITLTIEPHQDGIDEGIVGIETAKFVFSPSDGCPNSDSVQFNIIDTDPIRAYITHDSITSFTANLMLRDSIVGGMPNRNVTWRRLNDDGWTRSGDSVLVVTAPDNTYILEVQDFCGNIAMDTILVGRRSNFTNILRDTFGTDRLSVLRISDTTICDMDTVRLFAHGADSCVWYTSLDHSYFNMRDTVVAVTPHQRTWFYCRSYMRWNNQWWEDLDSVLIEVVPLPDISVTANYERICKGGSVTLTASGAAQYSWDGGENFELSSSHSYRPDSNTVIHVFGLTNGAECYGHDTILIIVDTMPIITLSDPTGVCGGEMAQLNVETTAESFTWVANPSDPSLGGQELNSIILVNPSVTTTYTVNATNGVCFNSNSTYVAVEPMPIAIGEVNPTTVSLGNMEATFIDLSQNATTRIWELPYGETSDEARVSYMVPNDVDSVSVRLWAYNPYQCFDTTTVTVYVDHTTLWTPNAFTPDESTNRTFDVKVNDVQRYHILIYDRRGQLVFESYDPEKPWDGTTQNGKICPQGVYTFVISLHKITHPYDQIVQHGTVLLIR